MFKQNTTYFSNTFCLQTMYLNNILDLWQAVSLNKKKNNIIVSSYDWQACSYLILYNIMCLSTGTTLSGWFNGIHKEIIIIYYNILTF